MEEAGSSDKQGWYRVFVASEAELIVPASSEIEATSIVRLFCRHRDNLYLGIDTETMMDHAIWGKPLSPIEEDYYTKVSAHQEDLEYQKEEAESKGSTRVRLVTEKRKLPPPRNIEANQQKQIIVDENQFCLFAVKTVYDIGGERKVYSYFPELSVKITNQAPR